MLLWWSLFRDRARGRRRCPKCWYDMAGVPGLVCPECGRDGTQEKGLLKTRRRWRFAGIGALIAIAGSAALCTPTVRGYGARGLIPTPALMLLASTVSDSRVSSDHPVVGRVERFQDSLLSELALRAQDPQRGLSDRQWQSFVVGKQVVQAWRAPHDGGHFVVLLNDQSFMGRLGQFVIMDPSRPDRSAPSQSIVSTGTDDGPWHMFRSANARPVPEDSTRGSRTTRSIDQRGAEADWIEVDVTYRLFIDRQSRTLLEPPRVVWRGVVRIPIQERDPHDSRRR